MPISLRLSPAGVQALDDIVRQGNYRDRSDAIRDALDLLREALESEEQEEIMVRVSKADYNRLKRAKVIQ